MRLIPLDPNRGKQTFVTPLGDTRYRFRFRYRARAAAWFMDLEQLDGTVLLRGARVGVMRPILGPYRAHEGFPDGEIILVDLQVNLEDPTRDEVVSERRLFVYISPEDSAAITAAVTAIQKGEGGSGGVTT